MRLQNAELLRTVVAAQRKAEIETNGWDCLPPMDQRIILEVRESDGPKIMWTPPQSIHHLLNAINATALQADYALTYAGHNLYLSMSFCQDLL